MKNIEHGKEFIPVQKLLSRSSGLAHDSLFRLFHTRDKGSKRADMGNYHMSFFITNTIWSGPLNIWGNK